MMHSTGDGVGWILLVVTLWALVAGGAFWAGSG